MRWILAGGFLSLGVAAPASATIVVPAPASVTWGQFQENDAHGGAVSEGVAPPLEQAWRWSPPEAPRGVSGVVVAGDTAVVAGSNAVYGIDVSSGDQSWTIPRVQGPLATPAVGAAGGRDVLVYTEGHIAAKAALVAVDLADRHELWRVSLKNVAESGVTISDDQAIVGDRAGNLYSFDLATGSPATWSPQALGTGGIDAPPAATPTTIVSVTRNHDTGDVRVVAVDRTTGNEIWNSTTGVSSGTATGVTIDGDRAVFGIGNEQRIHAVRVDSKGSATSVWSRRTRSTFSPVSAAAVAAGTVFLISTSAGDAALYALDSSTGDKRWDFQFQTPAIETSPIVIGETVFVGTEDGFVAGIDRASGIEVWLGDTGDGAIGPLAATDDLLLASKRGTHGGVVAFRNDPDGTLLHVESPTKLHLGTDLGRMGMAFVIALAAALGLGLLVRRVRTAPPEEPQAQPAPDSTEEPEGP